MRDHGARFDPVLHSGPRITIMSRLAIHRHMRFAALRRATGLTGGNLAAHLEVLAKAGYVTLESDARTVAQRKTIAMTPNGDVAFSDYLAALRAFLADTDAALTGGAAPREPVLAPEGQVGPPDRHPQESRR